ncbi:MAG: DUF503 domain-containing protein [Actinomycetota bacterium]
MWACAVRLELRLPGAQSLKEKRAMLRPHIERVRRMASLSVAEIDGQDLWQRATVGVAIAASGAAALDSLVERLRRYFDSQPDIELVEFSLSYLEEP